MSAPSQALAFPRTSATIRTLANGLEIIVKEDSSAPVVSLQAWCRAGSIHEGDWLGAGMSHYLEHMLFKGTARRDASEVAQTVQSQGGYVNAYTSFDRTVYWIDAPAKGTEVCLDVLCDVVGFAELDRDEFASESEVIRREIAMGEDNPDQVLSKALFRAAYAVHPCRYPVIGHLDLFNQLTRDDLYAYYQEKYSPDNLFLVIVGDVDTDEVVAQIEAQLGSLLRRRRSPVILPDEPEQLGIRRETVEFPTDLFRGRLAYPAPNGNHRDAPALDLMVDILGGGRSSLLYRSIREEKQLAHSVGAYAYTPSFSGQLMLSFDTEPEKSEAAEIAINDVVAQFRNEGVSSDDLEKSKKQALSSQFSTLTDMRSQASDLGSNWLLTRNLDYTRDFVEQVQEVSVGDIQRVAQTYLTPHRFTRVTMEPQQEAVAKSVKSRQKRSDEIRRIELESGLTVLLLADKRVPFVQAQGVFQGGLLSETSESNGLTRLMARLLTKDTAQHRSSEVSSLIESVGGGISSSIGNNTFGVSTYAMRPDLDLVVSLLGDGLLDASFLDEVVDREREFQLAQIKAEADRPFSVAMKRLRKEIYGSHPYALEPSGTEKSLETLFRKDIVGIHGDLVRGGNGVVGVFGDLDLGHAEDLIRSRFGNLQAGPREFSTKTFPDLPASYGGVYELTHEKEQAVLLIGYRTVDLLHEDNPALQMIDEACSDMASRMFIRIREELGLAYSVGATRMQGLEPGMIIFYVSTSPEKLDLVQREMLAEIDLMVNEGLEQSEFDRAKASWLGQELIELQGVRELASAATVDELVGLGWDNYRKTPETVDSLTQEQVKAVAGKYLREDNRVIVRLTTA